MFSRLFSAVPRLLAIASILVFASASAHARLGETREEIEKRYGKPIREPKPILAASESAALYLKDRVEVTIEFKRGKAWLVSYRTGKLNSDLEAEFRDANDGVSGVGEWKDTLEHLGRTYWVTEDKQVYGVRFDLGNSKIFRFVTIECMEALEVERKQKVKEAQAIAESDASEEDEDEDSGF